MLEELTPDSVFSQVIMEEPAPLVVLLVEGPDEDAILYEHLNEGVVRIIAGSKKAVVGAAQTALDAGRSDVFGLVDRDLDSLRGLDVYPSNVVATDAYDLIADLVRMLGDDAFRRVINAHAAPSVRTVESVSGRNVADLIFDIAGPLAAVRLAALRSSYPLILRNYEFRHVVTTRFDAADISLYVRNAVCRNPTFVIDSAVMEDVRARMAEVVARRHSGGHDLVGATLALITVAGGAQVSKKAISGNLISFATCDLLASIPCIQLLRMKVKRGTGTDLLDCLAA